MRVVHSGFTQNAGRPVPIVYRPPHWQKNQAQVAAGILRHVRRQRQRTVISALGRLILVVHSLLPRLGD